jgi:hypothetical protein
MKKLISDEMLFAYVDEELDAAGRAEVEAAMAADPALAQRVQQQRSLRTLLGAAYRPVLEEPVPPRLVAAAQARPAKARVLELASARDKRKTAAPAEAAAANDWSWKHWGGMAACLVVGVLAGYSGWLATSIDNIATRGGQLVASGELARALSTQLAMTQAADAPVRIGLSFLSRDDEYCRSFTLATGVTGGLACRRGDEWTLRVVSQDKPLSTAPGGLRQAASPVPPAVLKVVDEQMVPGGALDAAGEKLAMSKGWRK